MSYLIPNQLVFKSSRHTALFLLIELYKIIEDKITNKDLKDKAEDQVLIEFNEILSNLLNQDSSQNKKFDYTSHSPQVIKFIKFYLEFNHISERFHRIYMSKEKHLVPKLMTEFEALRPNINPNEFKEFLNEVEIDLVFTAHPTEIFERKILKKYIQLHKNLKQLLNSNNFNEDSQLTKERKSILLSLWLAPDYGSNRPTPKDEAKLGQLIYQYSLWDGLTKFKKRFYNHLKTYDLPLDTNINFLRFSSWMGSDKDGNPNVTAIATEEVIKSFAKKSLNLYFKELKRLKEDLCFEIAVDGKTLSVEDSIDHISNQIGAIIKNDYNFSQINLTEEKILNELSILYRQLTDFDAKFLADIRLRSLIDRLESFGLLGMRWDVRQESAYHDSVIDDIFKSSFIDVNKKFSKMNEQERQLWIKSELNTKSLSLYFENLDPLNPDDSKLTKESIDFINTIKLIKKLGLKTFPYYVISMTRSASDLLLIKKFFEILKIKTQVVPLFETLEDLENSSDIMTAFLKISIENLNTDKLNRRSIPIMLGYSDSAKTGSRISSVWNLYLAQKKLTALCESFGFKCQFFHGRGGSIGRGGGPVQHAVSSCPIESVQNGFRMTVQGEVIFDRFGFSSIAVQTMMTYAMSLINYKFMARKNKEDLQQYELIFAEMSESSKFKYRSLINKDKFMDYFEKVTPVEYMSDLNIGSRPSKRKSEKKSYRAIPWIFGWTQNRCLLPSWYGFGTALEKSVEIHGVEKLKHLYDSFFLFRSTLDLVYMTYLKVDMSIFKKYDLKLAKDFNFYSDIEDEFLRLKKYLLEIVDPQKINHVNLEEKLYGRLEILEHLHDIQIELLKKNILDPSNFSEKEKNILLLTIQALASGMGNTG